MRADHEFSQNISDSGRAAEGRSIGDVRDKSAPTADLFSWCLIRAVPMRT